MATEFLHDYLRGKKSVGVIDEDVENNIAPLDVGAVACAVRQSPNLRRGNDSHRPDGARTGLGEHRQSLKQLHAEFGPMPFSIAGMIAAMIAGLGLVALIGVTLRL